MMQFMDLSDIMHHRNKLKPANQMKVFKCSDFILTTLDQCTATLSLSGLYKETTVVCLQNQRDQ